VRLVIKNFSVSFLLSFALLTAAFSVRAYEPQFADAKHATPLRWKNGAMVNISFSNSLKQAANIKPGSDVAGAIERSLATWERAARIKFNFSWTDKLSISPQGSGGDGASLVTIAAIEENLASFAGDANSELAGRTRVFYTSRGIITEADIALNPYQQFSTDGAPGTYDLQATLTHEIGHLLGLSHSDVLGATMHAQQGKNGTYSLPAFAPRTLADDDRAGVRALYGAPIVDDLNCCGEIAGTLANSAGKPLAGLTVWAQKAGDGRLAATTRTAANGAFNFEGLTSGRYKIFAQNEKGGISAAQIGETEVAPDTTATLSGKSSAPQKTFDFRLVGFSGQLSTVAVPINAGRSYHIFIGGNFNTDDVAKVETDSSLLTLIQASVSPQDYGARASVLSFQIDVAADAPKGEYSLRLVKKSGETVYLLGCLTIDDVPNESNIHFLGE
jgi:hypothetical protein